MKSKNRWDVVYETVDEATHTLVEHFAAQNVDWKTALMIKRNHKKICAMQIRLTRHQPDAAITPADGGQALPAARVMPSR